MSKELEALEELYKQIDNISALAIRSAAMPTLIAKEVDNISNKLKVIKQALIRLEKLEKALEIVEKHPMLINLNFKYTYEEHCKFYRDNIYIIYNREPKEKFYCSKETYELLKGVFER